MDDESNGVPLPILNLRWLLRVLIEQSISLVQNHLKVPEAVGKQKKVNSSLCESHVKGLRRESE
jgi:hypothetical protein